MSALLCFDSERRANNVRHTSVEIQSVRIYPDLWHQKTRVLGVVCVMLFLDVLTQYRRVIDGHTYRHDDSIASRGNKSTTNTSVVRAYWTRMKFQLLRLLSCGTLHTACARREMVRCSVEDWQQRVIPCCGRQNSKSLMLIHTVRPRRHH